MNGVAKGTGRAKCTLRMCVVLGSTPSMKTRMREGRKGREREGREGGKEERMDTVRKGNKVCVCLG